ncbi:hypothetical protein VKT23_013131 [Stygiomarasmius scandens]|uniref:Uncharacterized protein n=1 Tax=Marasmiellus scandens TaxID=2682957 RepID=A0ABR1J6G4_9AGAR
MPCIFTSELQNFNSSILAHLDLRTANRIARAIVITLVVYSLCYLIQLSLPSGETNAQDVEPPQSMYTVEKNSIAASTDKDTAAMKNQVRCNAEKYPAEKEQA